MEFPAIYEAQGQWATMHILLMQTDLHFPCCHSLKQKRSLMKPLLNRVRNDFNVSAAEVDWHDEWQYASIAFIGVATDRTVLERLERNLEKMLETHHDAHVCGWHREWI